MPPNTPIFILGLVVGTSLLVLGLLLGYWFGRGAAPRADVVDRQQFLSFLKNLSSWTSEFSGEVSKYQTQLSDIRDRVGSGQAAPPEELVQLLSQIMEANRQLQERLDNAEQKLEQQTSQISSYLTEARTDGLTGLFNRRAFDKAMDELFSSWTNKHQPYTLGLIDIDHFKQINDTYGHPAGDAVLKHIAATLQAELGDAVCVARYGGEEFAVLTLESADQAAVSLDRLRQVVSQQVVTHEDKSIAITLSAGVSQIDAEDKIGNLVRRSDEALYAAKLGGRNRVYLHDGTLCHLKTQVASAAQPVAATHQPAASPEEPAPADDHARVHERLRRIVQEESQRMVER